VDEQQSRYGSSGSAQTVARWLAIAGTKCAPGDLGATDKSGRQQEPPFVAEVGDLAALALESRHPERYLWIDESGITGKVGSRPAKTTGYRKHDLWIPPSAGWSALDRRAQQLVADVLVMLNLTEQAGAADSPDAREQRLERANRYSGTANELDHERRIGNCRRELPDRTLIWSQRHLMTVLREYGDFCSTHRPHRALNLAAALRPLPDGATNLDRFRVRRPDRAGGVIHEYRLVAKFRHPQAETMPSGPARWRGGAVARWRGGASLPGPVPCRH
jgi:hypothetical protein